MCLLEFFLKFGSATEFIWTWNVFGIIKSTSDLELFHNCSLKGGKRTILEQNNSITFVWHGFEPPTLYHKSNMKPLSYRTNEQNSGSDSLLTSKCELLFQMTTKSYLPCLHWQLLLLFIILIVSLCLSQEIGTGNLCFPVTISQII